jgi:hypothetical protein
MNSNNLKILSFRFILVGALICIAAIINSCRKDNKSTPQSVTDPKVAMAKQWYESNYAVNVTNSKSGTKSINSISDSSIDFSQRIKPDWQHPATYTRLRQNVIEMPINPAGNFGSALRNLPGSKKFASRKYNRSYFLLLNDSAGYHAYIMMIMADSAYVNNDFSKLNHNSYRKCDADFSGLVLYFTPKGRYVGGYAYAKGQLVSPSGSNSSGGQSQVLSVKNGTSKTTDQLATQSASCLDWYLITYYDDGSTDAEYLGTTCPVTGGCPITSLKPDCASGGGGTPPAPTCPGNKPPGTGSGGGSSGPTTSVGILTVSTTSTTSTSGLPAPSDPCLADKIASKIYDNVANPCVHTMVEAAISRNIEFDLQNSMNRIFGNNANFNLTFNDNPKNLIDPTDDGETTPTYTDAYIQAGTNRTIITGMDIDITLNSKILSGSSQEFVTATILHEALHAYFRTIGTMDDHNVMVIQYIPWFESTLKAIYPSMSDSDAQALAFGGLTQTMAMSVSSYSGQKSFLDNINNIYKDGAKGTPCQK